MNSLNVSPTFFRGQSTLDPMINLTIYPVAHWEECQLFNGLTEIIRSVVPYMKEIVKLDDYDWECKSVIVFQFVIYSILELLACMWHAFEAW